MFFRLLFVLCALCTGTLSAKLENHLRNIHNKGSGHTIKNVDFIYMINLDKRPEKFKACMRQLRPYGITPYRFSAVNGWDLSLETINDLGIRYEPGMTTDLMGSYYPLDGDGKSIHEIMHVPGRNYFCHCMSRGAIGCALSHLSVLQDALDSHYEAIWVMEDDISVLQDPRLISDAIDKLDKRVGKKNWDMLFTDQDTISNATGGYVPCRGYARRPNFTPVNPSRFSERKDVGHSFRKIGARYGLYSVIIRRSGIKKILKFVKKYQLFLPIDMEFYLPSDVNIYTVINDIVSTQRNALSDNERPGYQK